MYFTLFKTAIKLLYKRNKVKVIYDLAVKIVQKKVVGRY